MKTYHIAKIDLEAEVEDNCTEINAWYEVTYYDGSGNIRTIKVSNEKMDELFQNLIAINKIKLTSNDSIILLE